MSQLISSYVFCMILAKFIELRTHLLIISQLEKDIRDRMLSIFY